MSITNVDKVIEHVFDIFKKYGQSDYIGEEVTQTEHMVQTAMLAEEDKQDSETIVGALLHDIGHLLVDVVDCKMMDKLGVLNHEGIGAKYLRKLGFKEKTCLIVENHVNAKRYLMYKNKSYNDNVSEASKQTLKYQGGVFTKEQAELFEKSPYFSLYLVVRSYDEKAKDKNKKIKDIRYYYDHMKNSIKNNI